jgi:hypothetical protein
MEEGFYAPEDLPYLETHPPYLEAQPDTVPSAEEIPTPGKLFDQEIEAEPDSEDTPSEMDQDEQETVTQRDQISQPAKRRKRLSVSLRLDDADEPASGEL